MFSYGLYPFMYAYTSADSSGLPHSSHSITVSGSVGSRIVLSASTHRPSAPPPGDPPGARFPPRPNAGPPARPAPGDQPVRRRPAVRDQLPGADHEVGECVALGQQLALVVPGPPHLPAAAHVRDGEDEAPVQQR